MQFLQMSTLMAPGAFPSMHRGQKHPGQVVYNSQPNLQIDGLRRREKNPCKYEEQFTFLDSVQSVNLLFVDLNSNRHCLANLQTIPINQPLHYNPQFQSTRVYLHSLSYCTQCLILHWDGIIMPVM